MVSRLPTSKGKKIPWRDTCKPRPGARSHGFQQDFLTLPPSLWYIVRRKTKIIAYSTSIYLFSSINHTINRNKMIWNKRRKQGSSANNVQSHEENFIPDTIAHESYTKLANQTINLVHWNSISSCIRGRPRKAGAKFYRDPVETRFHFPSCSNMVNLPRNRTRLSVVNCSRFSFWK